jgi:hypothetical protein
MSQKVDPLWLAMSKLRRGKLEECINICNEILATNPGDQVIPQIKLIFWLFQVVNAIVFEIVVDNIK